MRRTAGRGRGRDLRLTRAHVWALGAGGLATALLAFTLGWIAARAPAGHRGAPVLEPVAEGMPDDALVELLARIESIADASGGVNDLTFPDTLTGGLALEGTGVRVAEEAQAAGGSTRVVLDGQNAHPLDAPPAGAFTLEVWRGADLDAARSTRAALADREVEAWVGAVLEGGSAVYHVSVGGYPDEPSAAAAQERIGAALADLPVAVVPIP